MPNELSRLLESIGALAEIMGVYVVELERNGFTRSEAIALCAELQETMLTQGE